MYYVLAISKLEGGTYTIDTLLKAVKSLTDMASKIGIACVGLALLTCFVIYSVVDVDKKQRTKERIIQTLIGIGGIVFAISLVNIIIGLFE